MNYRAVVFWFSIITFLLCGSVAFGHPTDHPQHGNYTQEEINWMKRQRNVQGQWCCGDINFTVLEDPRVRVRGAQYEVNILNRWIPVPPGSLHRFRADDPSPFPGEILLFFSTHGEHVTIWCLTGQTGG